MEFLKGWSRKLVIPLLAVFFIGWLIFFIGFMLYIHNEKNYIIFLCIPEIMAAIGPLLAVVGVLHAATSGPISAVLGSLTSFLSVFCIMGFGSVVVSSTTLVFYLYVLPSSPQQKYHLRMSNEYWLMLVGSWIAALAWVCVIIAWNCFSYDRKYNQVETIVDEEGNVTERSSAPSRLKRNVMFAGVARKLAIVALFLLGASWCLYIAGVIEESRNVEETGMISNTVYLQGGLSVPLYFGTWSTCVVGLFAILAAIGHTGSYGGASTAMGVFSAILGMFFIASASSVGFTIANSVYFICHYSPSNCKISEYTIPRYVVYQLSGAVGMCVWWACLSALKPFYFKETDKVRNSRRSTRIHQQYMQRQVQEIPYDERVPLLQGQTDTAASHSNRTNFSVF